MEFGAIIDAIRLVVHNAMHESFTPVHVTIVVSGAAASMSTTCHNRHQSVSIQIGIRTLTADIGDAIHATAATITTQAVTRAITHHRQSAEAAMMTVLNMGNCIVEVPFCAHSIELNHRAT